MIFWRFPYLSGVVIDDCNFDGPCEEREPYMGLRLFRVTEEGVRSINVDIEHTLYYDGDFSLPTWGSYAQMRRAFRIEDHLFALSDGAISTHPIDELIAPNPQVSISSSLIFP